jgi:threonine dehydrogenase-like Zn-dependent dehydrogenase
MTDQRCGATWWHAEMQNGQRVVIHHACGKYANAQHGMWHACTLHGAVERMAVTADRVKPGPLPSART